MTGPPMHTILMVVQSISTIFLWSEFYFKNHLGRAVDSKLRVAHTNVFLE